MRQLNETVNRLFESYQFGEAGRQVYEFSGESSPIGIWKSQGSDR